MVMGELVVETEVVVIGSGPGGYAAAFRAAALGCDVTVVDPVSRPGGVCLYQGCLPSKALLVLAQLLYDAQSAASMGIRFSRPEIDVQALNVWKTKVIDVMASGLEDLCRRHGVQTIAGTARFEDAHTLRLEDASVRRIRFQYAILATGSIPTYPPNIHCTPGGRIIDSTGALALQDIPRRLLIIGGGYIGLELGTLYARLGSQVHLVEGGDRLLSGVDRDLVEPLSAQLHKEFSSIHMLTEVKKLRVIEANVQVTLEQEGVVAKQQVDRVLIAAGRQPNSGQLGLKHIPLEPAADGSIPVDAQQRTAVSHIFAVGDVTGGELLAHKANLQGKVAAEVIAGKPSAYDVAALPAVVYTDPQIAWCGLTEEKATKEQIPFTVRRFPWKYSGRALTLRSTGGLTKLLVAPHSGRILGCGISGREAENLITEAVLAIEMGALAEDLAWSLHPHPTLSETLAEAASLYHGSSIHMLGPARKKS